VPRCMGLGIWALRPDTGGEPSERPGWGPLASTCVIFFFAEMGDKTQLATVALGARYASAIQVTTGTTLGMLAADGLAVLAAMKLHRLMPLGWWRRVAAALFFLFGLGPLVLLRRGRAGGRARPAAREGNQGPRPSSGAKNLRVGGFPPLSAPPLRPLRGLPAGGPPKAGGGHRNLGQRLQQLPPPLP